MSELRIRIDDKNEIIFYYKTKGPFHPTLKASIKGPLCGGKWFFIQVIENESPKGDLIRFLDFTQPSDSNFSPFYTTSDLTGGCNRDSNFSDEPINNLLQPGEVRFYTIFGTYRDDSGSKSKPNGKICKPLVGVKWGFSRKGISPAEKGVLPLCEISASEIWDLVKFLQERITEERLRFI